MEKQEKQTRDVVAKDEISSALEEKQSLELNPMVDIHFRYSFSTEGRKFDDEQDWWRLKHARKALPRGLQFLVDALGYGIGVHHAGISLFAIPFF